MFELENDLLDSKLQNELCFGVHFGAAFQNIVTLLQWFVQPFYLAISHCRRGAGEVKFASKLFSSLIMNCLEDEPSQHLLYIIIWNLIRTGFLAI